MNTKILFILHTPPPVHGSAIVGKAIKDSLSINEAFDCSYINLGTSRTVDEIGKNPFAKIGRYLRIVFQVLKQLIINKPNFCYLAITAKGLAFYKDSFIALIVKLFGIRVVYHFHNKGVSTRQHKAIDNFLYRRVFKNAHTILLSKYLYPDVEKYFTHEQVHYCSNGISDLDARQKTIDKRQNEKIEILFLSNLIESKGVFVLLEACKILKQKGLAFHCIYVGGEGDLTTLQFQTKVKKLGLGEHVVYVGKKFGNEKAEIFSKADIFVHPTFEDCFPLVLLEAMQHRLPTISTFEGGIRGIVEDGKTGFLVPQKNAEALAEKLEILIQNPSLRQQMGVAGRKKYEEEFTLNKFEERLEGILKEITNEHRKRKKI
ncbi:glycosyltransferase family 4 protein [Mariniphaga sp.]|uniref:glycosyltransferase family 4 protein n=1 Tax=Mariniphaga sp. TaxID=1954475 RepID=UPI003565D39C